MAAGIAVVVLVAGGVFAWHSLHARRKAEPASAELSKPVFVETPEMITNLDAGPHRVSFVKFQCRVQVGSDDEQKRLLIYMPRIVDMLQTYMREMRPEELRSDVAMFRLHEAFLARASIAAPGAGVSDVLFEELIVQ